MTCRRPSLLVLSLCASAWMLLGCGSRWGVIERAPGSAVEIATGTVSAPDLARLEEVGIRELWVDAGRLEWEAGRPVVQPRLGFTPPRRMTCTLIVRGPWAPGASEDEESMADDLAAGIAEVLVAAEAKGLFAAGVHFDLRGLADPSAPAAVLAELHQRIDETLAISATLPRELLDHPEAEGLTKAVDFVVAHLYGQPVGEAEVPTAWDFQQVERSTRLLEELEEPYLLGVSILGSTALLGASGTEESSTTVGLGDLVRARGLALEHGFTLEGIDRQVYAFRAEQRTRLGSWQLAQGQRVRLVGTSTPHLEELRRLLGVWSTPHRLGELYIRLPGPDEKTGLRVANLINALGPSPVMPEPVVTVESLPPGRSTLRMKIRLENPSLEPTDLGFVDHNFVELVAVNAVWKDIEGGDFDRFDLLKPDRSGELRRSLQSPTVLRLYVPLLEAGASLLSGPIDLEPRTVDPRIEISANFLVPSGRSASFGPLSWQLSR